MRKQLLLLCTSLVFMMTSNLKAQNEAKPVTRTYALTNANIITQPGQMIGSGTVIIENGLIKAVGKSVQIPANAKVIKADSMYVYAGFIDGLSHTGVPKPDNKGKERPRVKDPGNPPNKLAGITPETQVKDVLKPSDKSVTDMRKLGFTTIHAVPRGRMLPGSGALIQLSGKEADDMILKGDVSLFSQFSGARGMYPSTIIAMMSKYRELYKQAEQAKAHKSQYAANPKGIARPSNDRILEAFYPVIDRQQSVYFRASDAMSLHRVYMLQKELKFPLVLANVKQGWHIADKIKSTNTPVFLSLDLPESKDKKKKKKEEETDEDEETKAFEAKKAAAMKQYLGQAALFQEKGIAFGFSAADVKAKDIRGNLRKMIENGLKEETALAALTTVPAQHFGVSSSMGTIESGKLANLVITDDSYFAEKSNVRYVFVEGELFEYEVKSKKKKKGKKKEAKGDENAEETPNAKVAGEWSYTVEVPGNSGEGTLTIKGSDGDYTGKMSDDESGEEREIENIEVEGNKLTFTSSIDGGGQTINLEFSLTIDGDSFEGTVSVGQFGEFPVEGTKKPE